MNRVINHPDLVVEDMLKGWLLAHQDSLSPTDNPRVIKRKSSPQQGKVGIITGGGSGHEPAFLGYVGDGMVDAVAIGEIFSSPTAKSFLDAMRAADGGAGVACLYGNYAGDNMNVKMAIEMAARENITVKTVVANDDVPSAPRGDEAKRRGVAGEILMWKVGAAKADAGGTLDEVIAIAQKAINATRSIGIGLSACVIPAVGKANFSIEIGTMEVGIGHHGEPGINVQKTVSASEMAQQMLDALLPDLPFISGDRVAVLISGLGATPLMEQYILYGEVAQRLQSKGFNIAFKLVGNLFTSLEMMGVTLSLMKLDDELLACLNHPCQSVGVTIGGAKLPQVEFKTVQSRITTTTADEKINKQTLRELSGPTIDLNTCGNIVREMIKTIVANRQYLSEIDGLIGDGDHGINMAKGFNGCAIRLDAMGNEALRLPSALTQLSEALMDDIGGSMGPLYGNFFNGFVEVLSPYRQMDAALFGEALSQAVKRVQQMGHATVGDKTLIDTLAPALSAYNEQIKANATFEDALQAMSRAAEKGKDSTFSMQARIGRSARLGERSIGVLDAGATSCFLILNAMAQGLLEHLSTTSSMKN
nr:dihydroxyacetone kinase subunit DhaL [Sheuella amnicola]